MSKAKKKLIFSLLSIVTIVLIIVIGGKEYMNNKEKENLANQRLAALALKKEEPQATKVVFKYEGGSPGVGVSWLAGAEVTIGGEIFKYNLEIDNAEGVVFSNLEEANKFKEIKKQLIYLNNWKSFILMGKGRLLNDTKRLSTNS